MDRDLELLEHLRSGPKTATELRSLTKVSLRTLYKNVNRLVAAERVVVMPLRTRNQWTSLFALPEQAELAYDICGFEPRGKVLGMEKRIAPAISELRERLLRNPTIEEVLIRLRESPENKDLREAIYRVGLKLEWFPPSSAEIKGAEERLKRVRTLAGLIRKGIIRKGVNEEEMRLAQEYLLKFPGEIQD
ncbi:MAG: hypothetical protein QXO51_07530 [Halobacteria archaeon]